MKIYIVTKQDGVYANLDDALIFASQRGSDWHIFEVNKIIHEFKYNSRTVLEPIEVKKKQR